MVLIKCNGLYLLFHISGQMHVNMIISEPAVKIIKCNVNKNYFRVLIEITYYKPW